MSVNPSCPDNFVFKKENCLCIPKKKNTTEKKCKPGKYRNDKGRCVLRPVKQKSSKAEPFKPYGSEKKKVCKPGKEPRKSDGRCVKIQHTLKKAKPKTRQATIKLKLTKGPEAVIKNKSSEIERSISKHIHEKVNDPNYLGLDVAQLSKKMSKKSFSPSINKYIASISDSIRIDLFKCDDNHYKEFLTTLLGEGNVSVPYIPVGVDRNGKTICKKMNSKKGRDIMLRNVRNIKLDENQIIAPVQRKSNCWFNAMFVTFFFSDKGRKFFRYFREIMIKGETSNGDKIKPAKLGDSLLALNACIEASYGNKDIALAMNTNRVIEAVYNAIPVSKRPQEIRNIGKAGNPWHFYKSLMNVMHNRDLKYRDGNYMAYTLSLDKGWTLQEKDELPELVVFEIYDSECDKIKHYKHALNVKVKLPNGEQGTYLLDSAVVRDTEQRHFCALLTVNGKEFGFDGLSHSRMSPFGWKEHFLYHRDNEWMFQGSVFSSTGRDIKWKFNKAYHLLFYYRVK